MQQKAYRPEKPKTPKDGGSGAQDKDAPLQAPKWMAPGAREALLKSMSAPLQAKTEGGSDKGAGAMATAAPGKTGEKLPVPVQEKMQGAFGTGFNDVNIHKDDDSATQMGALAYAQGNDIHFAPGKYEPDTLKGQELLGHELAHVQQQRKGRAKPMPKLADIKPKQKSKETLSKERQRAEMWGLQSKSPEEQMQLKLKYGYAQLKSDMARTRYQDFKSSNIVQLRRDRQGTRLFRSKAKQFEHVVAQRKIDYGSEEYIQLAAGYFPGQDLSVEMPGQATTMPLNDSPALEKEADTMGKRAAEGKAFVNRKSSGIQLKPLGTVDEVIKELYEEIDGWGTKPEKIISILEPFKGDLQKISEIKNGYRFKYGISLEAHISSEIEGEQLTKINEIFLNSSKEFTVGLINQSIITNTNNVSKANSFSDIVKLVRLAEDKLIQSGYSNMEDRIKILRGIYYGTDWSMDFDKEQSSTRNIGFDVYTGTTKRPVNPQNIIGENLFNALKNSPEVKDKGRVVDFGHLIIGLDSRASYTARKINLPFQGGTGLEAVTWLGDLGGGVGMVCMKRINNPKTRTKPIVFNSGGHDYGAMINLEGDIAAYLVARDREEKDSPSYPDIKQYGYISDALADYLFKTNGVVSDDWKERVKIFTQMIGGKVESDKISNKLKLILNLTKKLAEFGGMYAVVRMKDSGSASEKNYRTASKHILGAAMETSAIFVGMLEKGIKNPDKKLVAEFDPEPKAPGKEYGILKTTADAMATAEKIKNYKE